MTDTPKLTPAQAEAVRRLTELIGALAALPEAERKPILALARRQLGRLALADSGPALPRPG